MNLRTRMTSFPALLALLFGALLALPAMAQQAQQDSGQPAGQPSAQQSKPKNGVEVARTTEDIRERILLDRIDSLEKRLGELEGKDTAPSASPAPKPAPKTEVADITPPAVDPSPKPAASPAKAQDTTPPPAAAGPPVWSLGPIDFSGLVDAYYSYNFNHPRPGVAFGGSACPAGGNCGATNLLYNFNIPTQQFSLNFVKLGLSHSPDPVGFEVDFGYGDTMTQIRSVSNTTGFDEFIENAFVSFKPMKAKGLEIDFGKFVTNAGAEVIESSSNWNYSRSLLFSWAIPYYHFGVKTSFPLGKHWTGGFQLVNGWNNLVDNNTSATLGANITGTYGKFTWTTNWYGGPENNGTNKGWRELFDTTLTVTANPVFAFYVNYDYAWQHSFNNFSSNDFGLAFPNGARQNWDGIALAAHITPKGTKWAFTGRYEWFSDPQGFATFGFNPAFDGDDPITHLRVQEFTGTVEYKFLEGLMVRGEYRVDFANQGVFTVNSNLPDPSDGFFGSKHQQTATIAMIAFFGPKR